MRCGNPASSYVWSCRPVPDIMAADDTGTALSARLLQDAKTVEPSQLRRAGLKITVPRMKILEILEVSHPRHMSAEDVYRRLLE